MRLIGRDRELHELKSALVEHRLVTVCGPAGVGKTRLVQEVLGSGAHYCSLSGVETLAELDRALLTALGAPSWDKGMTLTAPRALARALRPLVIDGVDAVANLVRSCVEHWLEQASQVRLVVTGLAPLATASEHAIELAPLSSEHAVTLYLEATRPLGAQPDLALAAEVVAQLECLPQAIESFAPLGALLGEAASLARLRATESSHAPLDRATEAAIAALDADDRRVLSRVAVFETGVSAPILEQLLGGDLARVDSLVRRCLLKIGKSAETGPRAALYRCAALILRQDAANVGDMDSLQLEHARAVLGAVTGLDTELSEARRVVLAERKELLAIATRFRERDPDLAAAACLVEVPLACEDGSAAELAKRLDELLPLLDAGGSTAAAGKLAPGKPQRRLGLVDACRKYLNDVVASSEEHRFDALIELAHVERMQSNTELALTGCNQALLQARERRDPRQQIVALGALGRVLQSTGRFRAACERHREAITLCRAHKMTHLEALERSLHARATHRMGAARAAIPMHEHALQLHKQHGEERLAAAELGHLGYCHHETDAAGSAEACFRASIAGLERTGDVALEAIERTLLARLLSDQERFSEARLELSLVEAAIVGLSMPRVSATRLLVRGIVEFAEGQLDDAAGTWRAALSHGVLTEVGFEALLPTYLALALRVQGDREQIPELLELGAQRIAAIENPALACAFDILHAAAGERTQPAIAPEFAADSSDVRRALRFVERVVAVSAVEVSRDGREVFLLDGTRVELARREAPRRMLLALVRSRLAQPGIAVSAEDMLDAGWPGEKMTPTAASKRVRTAIWTLRHAGLDKLILTREGGYLLDPRADVRWSAAD